MRLQLKSYDILLPLPEFVSMIPIIRDVQLIIYLYMVDKAMGCRKHIPRHAMPRHLTNVCRTAPEQTKTVEGLRPRRRPSKVILQGEYRSLTVYT
jgi:hypothetical protein